jgi:hypothetical protein
MDHNHIIRMFLDAQPHWLEHDVKYRQLAEGDEPEMGLSTTAMQAFLTWALDNGFVGKPELVPEYLDQLECLPQIHAAHDAGICHPETCPICRAQ